MIIDDKDIEFVKETWKVGPDLQIDFAYSPETVNDVNGITLNQMREMFFESHNVIPIAKKSVVIFMKSEAVNDKL